MKLVRLLELRKQQEKQARVVFSRAFGELAEETRILKQLRSEYARVVNLSHCRESFHIELLQQHACYLDKLRTMIRDQWGRVEDRKKGVQRARLEWDQCRQEKEKMEKLLERREQMQRGREEAQAQTYLDDIGRLLVLRGNQ